MHVARQDPASVPGVKHLGRHAKRARQAELSMQPDRAAAQWRPQPTPPPSEIGANGMADREAMRAFAMSADRDSIEGYNYFMMTRLCPFLHCASASGCDL